MCDTCEKLRRALAVETERTGKLAADLRQRNRDYCKLAKTLAATREELARARELEARRTREKDDLFAAVPDFVMNPKGPVG